MPGACRGSLREDAIGRSIGVGTWYSTGERLFDPRLHQFYVFDGARALNSTKLIGYGIELYKRRVERAYGNWPSLV